jgi:hypothetical protein
MRALAVALLAVLLLAGACSGDDSGESPDSTKGSTDLEGSTLASAKTVQEETTSPSPPEATLGAEPSSPGVVLRLEGDPETTFSGICAVGGEESVLSGRVPKRYAFDLDGRRLSCRIQKQDSGRGALKVILTVDDATRSVQQTNSRDAFINVTYRGG